MISSIQNVSAERNGERSLFRRSSISRSLACGIGRRVEVGAVGRLDTALERQRSPAPGGPRVAEGVARPVAVRGPGHAEHVPDDDGAPGHGGLPDRRHGAHALLDRPRALGLEPDQEARAVDEVDDGQVEGLGHVHEPLHLLAGVGGPGAAVVERVARHQRDRPPVEPRQARDDRTGRTARPISKNEPRSTTASTIARILYTLRGSRGTTSPSQGSPAARARRSAGRAAAGRGWTTAGRTGSGARRRRPPPRCRPRGPPRPRGAGSASPPARSW